MPQRNYSRERAEVAKPNKRVILPIGIEAYQEMIGDSARFRAWLDGMIKTYPELFPVEIGEGYVLHDTLPESSKLPGVRFRRIELKAINAEGKREVLTAATNSRCSPLIRWMGRQSNTTAWTNEYYRGGESHLNPKRPQLQFCYNNCRRHPYAQCGKGPLEKRSFLRTTNPHFIR
jgi:hypothetical protein